MSEPRKPLSRRDFFRLAGIGTGATMASESHFQGQQKKGHDRFKDPAGRLPRPWWVRTVEEPTMEINWDEVRRFNEREGTVRGPGLGKYGGTDLPGQLDEEGARLQQERLQNQTPGWALKDQAIYNAQLWDLRRESSFLGPQTAPTPEEYGVPKWKGSPDEAARIVRVAMRHFGAASVGFLEIDERIKKLFYSHDPDGKELVFGEVPQAYETESKRVIPNKAKYVIVYTIQMSQETLARSPTHTACQTTLGCYGRSRQIQGLTQEFLRGLGYMGLGEASNNALGISPAMATMAGLGEMSRLNRIITPEYGPMVRVFKMVTDLPLAVDKPINAGIMEFCKSCKKCAESCPPGALSLEDEPSWQVQGGWNNPGHKAWFEDSVACMTYWRTGSGNNCTICFAVCPFSKEDKAWIHSLVSGTVAVTPLFDSFFRSMDDAFGYGAQKDPEEWWHLDLPEYGIDTERST